MDLKQIFAFCLLLLVNKNAFGQIMQGRNIYQPTNLPVNNNIAGNIWSNLPGSSLAGNRWQLPNGLPANGLPAFTNDFSNVPGFQNGFANVVPALQNGYSNAVPALQNSFSNVVPTVQNGYSNAVPVLQNGFSNAVPALQNGFANVVPALQNGYSNAVPTRNTVPFSNDFIYTPELPYSSNVPIMSNMALNNAYPIANNANNKIIYSRMAVSDVPFASEIPATLPIAMNVNGLQAGMPVNRLPINEPANGLPAGMVINGLQMAARNVYPNIVGQRAMPITQQVNEFVTPMQSDVLPGAISLNNLLSLLTSRVNTMASGASVPRMRNRRQRTRVVQAPVASGWQMNQYANAPMFGKSYAPLSVYPTNGMNYATQPTLANPGNVEFNVPSSTVLQFGDFGSLPLLNGLPVTGITETVTVLGPETFSY